MENLIKAVLIDEFAIYTVVEVSKRLDIPEQLLFAMEEEGLFNRYYRESTSEPCIKQNDFSRIEAACRLHKDLQINLAGVVLALDLLEEIDELRHRLKILERLG